MHVSHWLRTVVCAGALGIAWPALAQDEPSGDNGAAIQRGERLFTEKCESCHTGATAPTADVLGEFDWGEFQGRIESHAPMGEIEDLTDSELKDIYAYVRQQAGE